MAHEGNDFGAPVLDAVTAADPATLPPVIMFGALRSGTTMLRLIMNMHPHLSCPGESDFLVDYLRPVPGGWVLDRNALEADRIFGDSGVPVPASGEGPVAVEKMVAALSAKKPGRRLILILHRGLAEALALLPDSPVVHLIRDPRDVAKSSIRMGWAGNVYYGINHWCNTETEWDANADTLAGRAVHSLRYEDLVKAPQDYLHELSRFMGVEYDPDMLRFHETSSYKPIDPKLATQWRNKLKPREVALVEARVGDLLQRRGFEPNGARAAARPGKAGLARLRVQDKLARLRFSIREYGLGDTMLNMLSRRLHMPGFGKGARQRINEKVTARLH